MPLHGGANEAAMEMIEQWSSADEAEAGIMSKLANKELIMGFGHAVYKERDPRNAIIKKWSKVLSENADDSVLYDVSERCEAVMKREKGMFCNADFFHGRPTRLNSGLTIVLFAQVQNTLVQTIELYLKLETGS